MGVLRARDENFRNLQLVYWGKLELNSVGQLPSRAGLHTPGIGSSIHVGFHVLYLNVLMSYLVPLN